MVSLVAVVAADIGPVAAGNRIGSGERAVV